MAISADKLQASAADEDWKFFVRIDSPSESCSLYGQALEVFGWYFAPENSSDAAHQATPEFTLLVEELHGVQSELAAGLGFLGYEVSQSDRERSVQISSIATSRSEEQIVVPEGNISGVTNSFELCLRFDEFNSQQFPAGQRYRIAVQARLGEQTTISNTVVIYLPPREHQSSPIGGLRWTYSVLERRAVLLVDGWVLAPRAQTTQGSLYFGETHLGDITLGIVSEEESRRLPGLAEAKNARFQSALCREDLVSKGIAVEELERGISFQLRFQFSNGDSLELSTPCIRWFPEDDAILSARYTRVDIDEQNQLCLAVHARTRGLDAPRVYLKWISNQLDFQDTHCQQLMSVRSAVTETDCANDLDIDLRIPTALFGSRIGALRCRLVDPDTERSYGVETEAFERFAAELVIEHKKQSEHKTTLPQWAFRLFSNAPEQKPTEESSANNQRLVFATHNLSNVEGAPKVLASVVKAFVQQNPSSAALVISSREGPLRAEFEQAGIEVRVVPELDIVYQTHARYRAGLEIARDIVRQFGATVVYANVVDSFWAVDLASRLSIPSIFAIHESADPFSIYPNLSPALRSEFLRSVTRAQTCVFVSEATKKVFQPLRRNSKDIVIPNGLPLAQFAQVRNSLSRSLARQNLGLGEGFTVCSIGTTTKRKGQDVLLTWGYFRARVYCRRAGGGVS